MPDNQDITLKIRVLDAQGQFRGGAVDVEFKHRTLSDLGTQRALDASREINIAGLRVDGCLSAHRDAHGCL